MKFNISHWPIRIN